MTMHCNSPFSLTTAATTLVGVVSFLASPVQAQQLPTAARNAFAYATAQDLITVSDPASAGTGSALLTILENNGNVQVSNYGGNSFRLFNTGPQRIVAAFIDVTESIFSDIVFDDDGSGGDNVAKELNYDSGESDVSPVDIDDYQWLWLPARTSNSGYNPSAPFNPNLFNNVNNLFVDEVADSNDKAAGGYRGELLLFQDFETNEAVGFSGDMDPNCIAGLTKGTVDNGANWDVGGVSGAEMVHGVVSILFGDGSTASARIAADGSQAGSVAVLRAGVDGLPDAAPGCVVNGAGPGSTGSYNAPPSVVVSGSPGDRVRVSLVSGFDPVTNTKGLANGQITVDDLVEARLQAQYPEFPVSNSKEWQHEDVTIGSSGSLDVSDLFDYDEDLPIAFVAVTIDNEGWPLSETSEPIRLLFSTGVVVVPPTTPPTTSAPVVAPTPVPTSAPVPTPTDVPTRTPTVSPTESPTESPTDAPVPTPTDVPTRTPTTSPTNSPTDAPVPTPTNVPTAEPSVSPTSAPTQSPTSAPVTDSPTKAPTASPVAAPTDSPTTAAPSMSPTTAPTTSPTDVPTSAAPVTTPTTNAPSASPTAAPTTSPTDMPTSEAPVATPTTSEPTGSPVESPTEAPVVSPVSTSPTVSPTETPVESPTDAPVESPTSVPTTPAPTSQPIPAPTDTPTTASPVAAPIAIATAIPAPTIVTNTPVPVAFLSPPDVCTRMDFQGECRYTSQCQDMYEDADDCWNLAGGVCYCNGEVCGCGGKQGPTPPPAQKPDESEKTCSRLDFQKECRYTGQCQDMYPGATDCWNKVGGVCYCGLEVCGCQEESN